MALKIIIEHKEKTGSKIPEVKLSNNSKESREVVIKNIDAGVVYRTKTVHGPEVKVIDTWIKTTPDSTKEDNLDKLPTYK